MRMDKKAQRKKTCPGSRGKKSPDNGTYTDLYKIISTAGRRLSASLSSLSDDVEAILERDPAATSRAEVILLYSGFHAVAAHRLAHCLQKAGYPFPARAVSQLARLVTGIEIHPGAKIGKGLFIDHGSGVVIGETTEIGDNCTIYQGVTLGGTGKDLGKRHPTLGDGVMVGAGAKVLGPFRVGDGAKIAAGAVVLEEVPAGTTAVGIPARIVEKRGARKDNFDQVHIPDPLSQEICALRHRIDALEKKLQEKE